MRYSEYLEKKKEDPTFGMSPLSRQNLNNRLSELNALIGGYQTDVDSLLDDYKTRKDGYVAGTYRGDAQSWYNDSSVRADAIIEKGKTINALLKNYGQYYDPSYISDVRDALANNGASVDTIRNQAENEWSYWGHWTDENAYNAYLDRINKAKDRWAGIEAEAAELGKIRDALDGTSKYSSHTYGDYAGAAGRYTNYKNNQKHNQNSNNPIDTWMYGPGAGSGKEYGPERAAQDQALMQEAHASNPYYSTLYNGLKSESDLTNEYDQRYEQFSANFNEVAPIIATSDPDYEKYVEEGKRKAKQASAHEESFSKENLASYNKDTRNLAYYYLGKGEVDYAKLVLGITYNDDTIAYLQGRNLAAEKVNDSFLAEIPRKIYHSAVDAFQSTGDKLKNYLTENDEYVAPSKHGYAVQFAQADDEGLKAKLGDGAISLGRLAPSVLVSTVATAITKNPSMGAKIGSVVFGLGAAADAYNEKIREGYTATQAYTYGTLSGVSEVVLERILGGAGMFIGGKFGKAIANKFDDGLKTVSRWINKAIGRVATEHSDDFLKFAANGKAVWGDGVQEWFEEVVQAALEPGFEYIATGHTDGVTAEELFYNGVVGFLTAPLSSPIKVASGAYHGAKAAVNAANKSDYNHMANKMGANFDANGDSIPVVPGSIAETKAAAVDRDINAVDDIMTTIYDDNEIAASLDGEDMSFIDYATEYDEMASELFDDPEVKAEIESYDSEANAASEGFTPSNGVVEARDPNKEYMETGKLVPLTADQEWRQMEAAKAKNDIQKSGILAGVSKADIAIAEIAAKVTGRNIIFRSDEYGINGHFDGANTIFINPDRKDGVLSQIIAHELVHTVEGTAAYKALVKSVKAFVEANNFVDSSGVAHDWDYYVTEAHAAYDTRYEGLTGEVFTDEKADKEAVAKIIESFFSDTAREGTNTQAALDTWLTEYTKSNRNAALRMWYSLTKTARRIGEDIAAKFKKGGNTPELQKQREMLRRIEDIRDSFGRALIEAKKDAGVKKLEENGIGFDDKSKSAYSLSYSSLTNKNFDREELAGILSAKTGRSYDDCLKWIDGETSLAAIVMGHAEYLDYEADQRYEAIKTNSDYPQGTIDFSNLCPKREEFTAMFDILQKRYPNRTFTAEEIADMRNILKSHGVDVACGICYVEDRRQLLGEIADIFIDMWKKAVEGDGNVKKVNAKGESKQMYVTAYASKAYGGTKGAPIKAKDTYIPTQYDLNTYEGFKKLSEEHPTIAMAFEVYNRSRGQQSGRYIEGHAEYKRQILKWSDAAVAKVNANGGLRIFSFSDFQTIHMLDLVQIIIDCAARGVKIQGYTKVPALAKLLRGTGVKLNRSFVPAGEMGIKIVNGKEVLDIDPVEGINPNDRDFVNDPDDPDIGNVIIGINDDQIRLAMLDPNYDYIIPFHTNKSKLVLHKLNIAGWMNYKDSQHEKGGKSRKDVNIYTDVIAKYHPKNKVEFVEAFLRECEAQGKIPRFAQFLDKDANGRYVYTEGYHKLLLDFKMFDSEGNILEQGEVSPEFDVNYMTKLALRDVRRQKDYTFNQEVYDELDAKYGDHGNSKSNKSSFSFTEGSDYGTMPMTERESMMRDRALEMYDKLDRGEDIGMPKGMEDANEYIYGLTGWSRNEFGNLIVDHEAPVYLKERTDRETAAERRADIESARASASGTEAAVLRAERDELKVRAEAAEKAKRILERDMNWRIAADRQLSPNFTHSRDQVRGIVKELCDMFGGHYNDGQIRGFTERLQQLYDKIGTDAKYAADVTKFSREISDLITDMQDVRIKNTDNAVIAERLRAELRTPVFLSDKARGDFAEGYGKMAKHYRGKVNFASKERGTPVDVRYMELSDAFPEWFPSDITNEADQAKRILEVSDIIRDDNFTSHDRYADVGADPKEVRNADFDSALMRILNGYAELEAVPVTFADGLMRQLEFERREHQRELARMTDEERAKAEKKHNAEVERIMREAEQAMEWETKHLRDDISELEGQIKAEDDRKKAAAAEKDRREHLRGRDIKDAAIIAARSDKSFTKKMTELYERYNNIENELERVKSECKKYEKVSLDKLSKKMREYVKNLRERRDALAEDKANLAAYINKVNERVKGIRFKTLVEMIEKDGYLKKWKDKDAPIFYSVNTMRRNILDIAPKNSELARYIIDEIIDPIVNATAEATRLKNDIRERVRKLELSTKAKKGDTMSESQFVQAYAEAKDNIEALEKGEGSFIYDKYGNPCREGMNLEEWRGFLNRIIEENKGITDDKAAMERIEKAVEEFKLIYDNLFESVNAARVRNGYAPVPYHRGYFPHYNNDTAQDNIFAKMLDGFGLRTQDISEKLPTSINGLTSTFKPGIRYMSAAKQRSMAGFEGERVVTGAVEGVDRYLEVAADIAYLTDYVQELRSLSKAIRYATTSEATKERIDEIRADDSLTQDDKQTRINEIFANKTDKTKYALSNFVVELEEYTNLLAGKKSRRDREWESEFGRSIYNLGKKITRNVGANQIVANVSSWLTNTVPLTQGTAIMHYHMLTGLFDMVKGNISDDGFAASSTFLTNRRGSERLIRSKLEKASDAASFGMPLIDNIVSEWLMRARVAQNMSKLGGNMSREAALAEADTFISGMMANRTKAEMPTIFAAQNPLYKMFTTYQLEVANTFGFLKDLWRYDEEKLAKFLAQLFFTYLLSKIYNDYFEKLTGRRPAFDPLEILNDFAGDISGYKLASFDEIISGNPIEESKAKTPTAAAVDTVKGAAEEIPFIGNILGGGRIPISSSLPDFQTLSDAMNKAVGNFYDEDDPRSEGAADLNDVIETFYKGLSSMIYYGVIPFAGGAIKKAVEGGVAAAQGGSYTYNSEGAHQLQYPIYQDSESEALWNGVKAVVFGKTSTEGGREWVEGGFGYLSAKNTSLYETLVEDGTSQHDAFEAVNTVRKGDNQLGKAEALLEIDYLSDEAKFEIFKTLVTESTKKIEAAQAIIDKDGDFDEYLEDFVEEKKESENKEETDEKDGKKKKSNSGNLSIDIPKFEIPKYDIEIPKFKF